MVLKLNGTNSVSEPGFAGDDTDTGLQCGTNELNLVTGGTARATVDTNGRLGVGTTSMNKLLHVKGDSPDGTVVLVEGATGSNSAGIQFEPATGDIFEYQVASGGNYVSYNRTDNRTDIFVKPDGGTAFGSTTTTGLGSHTGNANVCTFHHSGVTLTQYGVVAGFYYDRLNFTNSQYFLVNSSGTGVYLGNGSTSFTAHSDERLKTNITELDSIKAYDHVKTARAASFKWNATGYPTDTKIGFIAQDWETNYPEVTNTTSETIDSVSNPKGIQYTETIPVLMAALKETIKKLEVAEAKISTLETKVATLEAA